MSGRSFLCWTSTKAAKRSTEPQRSNFSKLNIQSHFPPKLQFIYNQNTLIKIALSLESILFAEEIHVHNTFKNELTDVKKNLKINVIALFCRYSHLKWTKLGDNSIQNFHLGRYIVGYTVGNLVLRRRVSGAVKRDFRPYIRRYTYLPNKVIPILMLFCSFVSISDQYSQDILPVH